MNRATLLMMALGMSAMTARTAAADGHPADFLLHNETGFQIHMLHISEANDEKWGDDLLSGDPIDNHEKQLVKFHGDASACVWDIRIEDSTGHAWTVEDLNLCTIHKVKFFTKDKKVVFTKE